MSRRDAQKPGVEDRWWVDTSEQKSFRTRSKPAAPVGERLFRAGADFNQAEAPAQLADINRRLIDECAAAEGEWAYLATLPAVAAGQLSARVKRQIQLPPTARGIILDCGYSLRLLVTGRPPGHCILEFRIGPDPSFDCWVDGEWVREETFRNTEEAFRKARLYIRRYFG